MKRSVISVVCLLIVDMAVATPTDSELAKSEPGVAAIVSDVEKRVKGDNGKIADELVSLEGEASSAAEKFLFRREAVLRFLRAGKFERARDVLKRFVDEDDAASVRAVDDYINRLLPFKVKRSLKSTAGYEEYAGFVRDVTTAWKAKGDAERRIRELEAACAKNPESVRNRNLLAMEYAICGNWVKAVPLFAKAKGAVGEAARAEVSNPEAKGKDAVVVADGWWDIVGKNYPPSLTQACRRHAVEWYRTALADEALPNLVKLRIGGRIEEIESQSGSESGTVAEKGEAADNGFPAVSVKGGELVRFPLDARGKIVMELSACPPGEFTMGEGHDRFGRDRMNLAHKVRLAYPYLVGRVHVTFGMMKAVDRKIWKKRVDAMSSDEEKFHSDDQAFGGVTDSDIALFLKKLNLFASKCRELRPYKGYEFRLPTEAEWVRAYQAGTNDEMDDITDDELKKYWSKFGNSNWKMGIPEQDVIKVLNKKPNAWGIANMVTGDELADTIPLPKQKDGRRAYYLPKSDRDCFGYVDFEENPVRVCTEKTACHIGRKGRKNKWAHAVMKLSHPKGEYLGGEAPCTAFRLVYGPKLDKLNVYPKPASAEKK